MSLAAGGGSTLASWRRHVVRDRRNPATAAANECSSRGGFDEKFADRLRFRSGMGSVGIGLGLSSDLSPIFGMSRLKLGIRDELCGLMGFWAR
ncbi:hypothetical protein OROMI_018850 [Orobanche minor]